MFDSLSEKLGGILDRLTRRGALSEADVDAALREVRRALLEADVALDVARAFVAGIKKEAVGVEVMGPGGRPKHLERPNSIASTQRGDLGPSLGNQLVHDPSPVHPASTNISCKPVGLNMARSKQP